MSWCGNQGNTAIAKYVCIAVQQLKMLWSAHELACEGLQLIHVVVRAIGRTDPLILGPLYQNRCIREQANIANVIAMSMGQRDIGNVSCLKSDRTELISQRLIDMVDDQFGQGRPAFGVVQSGFRNARIPKQPFASMFYQPTRRGELDAPPNILAGRPD